MTTEDEAAAWELAIRLFRSSNASIIPEFADLTYEEAEELAKLGVASAICDQHNCMDDWRAEILVRSRFANERALAESQSRVAALLRQVKAHHEASVLAQNLHISTAGAWGKQCPICHAT